MTINIKNKTMAREIIKDIISRVKAVLNQGYQCQVLFINSDQNMIEIVQASSFSAYFLSFIYYHIFNNHYQVIIKSNLVKRIQ